MEVTYTSIFMSFKYIDKIRWETYSRMLRNTNEKISFTTAGWSQHNFLSSFHSWLLLYNDNRSGYSSFSLLKMSGEENIVSAQILTALMVCSFLVGVRVHCLAICSFGLPVYQVIMKYQTRNCMEFSTVAWIFMVYVTGVLNWCLWVNNF